MRTPSRSSPAMATDGYRAGVSSGALTALALPPARAPEGAAELRGEVRAFVAEQPFEVQCDAWGSAWGASPEFSRALAARGWVGMTWPPEYGGGGRSPLGRWVATQELLAARAPA